MLHNLFGGENSGNQIQINTLISGDDEGIVKIWDLRTRNCIFEFEDNEDFISDFAIHSNHPNTLIASG